MFSFLQNLGGNNGNPGGDMNIEGSAPIVINAQSDHSATIFFFHGLGDQGHGCARIFREDLVLPPHVKVVCPNAAARPVAISFGFRIPAWFNILGLTETSPEDAEGIQRAAEYVHGLINAEINAGIPSDRIVLAGMSMGGALALFSGLTFDKPLGAIVGLSSYLLQRDRIPGTNTANLNTPVFLAHGTQDPLVPFDYGRRTHEAILTFNPNALLIPYPMGHSCCADEMNDVKDFLENILK